MASLFLNENIYPSVEGIELFIESESYSLSGQTSSLPINLGAGEVADNFILQPTRISLKAHVFNRGLGLKNDCRFIATQLEDVFRKGEPVTLVLALKVYESVILNDLSINYDGRSEFIEISLSATTNEFLEYDSEGKITKSDSKVTDPIARPRLNLGEVFNMKITMPLDLSYPNSQINAVIDSQEVIVVLQWNTTIEKFTFSLLSPKGEILLGSLLLIQDFNLIEDFPRFQGSLIFNGSDLIWSGDEL